jgi:hypothetical protein
MKKTIMLLTFVFAVAMTNYGQDKTATINLGGTYQEASFNDADTITENRTLYTVQFNAAQNYPTTQDFLIAMDSIDAPEMAVQLQGSKFGDSYSSIGSAVNWVGTTGEPLLLLVMLLQTDTEYIEQSLHEQPERRKLPSQHSNCFTNKNIQI